MECACTHIKRLLFGLIVRLSITQAGSIGGHTGRIDHKVRVESRLGKRPDLLPAFVTSKQRPEMILRRSFKRTSGFIVHQIEACTTVQTNDKRLHKYRSELIIHIWATVALIEHCFEIVFGHLHPVSGLTFTNSRPREPRLSDLGELPLRSLSLKRHEHSPHFAGCIGKGQRCFTNNNSIGGLALTPSLNLSETEAFA